MVVEDVLSEGLKDGWKTPHPKGGGPLPEGVVQKEAEVGDVIEVGVGEEESLYPGLGRKGKGPGR